MADKQRKKKGVSAHATSQNAADGLASAAGTVCAEDLLSQFSMMGASSSQSAEVGQPAGRTQFTSNLGAGEDPELVACLKKLNKKDSTTRMRGLTELLALTAHESGQSCWTASALTTFVQSYSSRLAVCEEDWRVRNHSHKVMQLLCKIKHLKKHVRGHFGTLWPTWLIAMYAFIFTFLFSEALHKRYSNFNSFS